MQICELFIKVSIIFSGGILASDRGPPIQQLDFSPRPCEETTKEIDQEKEAADEEESIIVSDIPTPPRSSSQENEIKVRSII